MRKNFEASLDQLNESLITMADMVTESISQSVICLRDKNVELAKKVIANDVDINSKEKEIEAKCVELLLREQPVASDLRFVTSILKMITDLERIGDQAADIAFLNVKLTRRNYEVEDLGSVIEMAKITKVMVEDAIKAHVTGDSELAVEVVERDEKVDELFTKVRKEVIADIKSESFTAKNSLDIFMISKYLERIGDHAGNIGRRVYFSLKGEHLEE
ncbi:MAG: phosphate signaling complex protein PhoU [Tissierellia bacterium]|nr:phosphate signaling complex protein PhoU [Tissierellia bacterium]